MQGYVLIKREFVAVAAILVALLFAAGCGGSDESTTASSENPSTNQSDGSSGESPSGSSGESSGGLSGNPSDGLSNSPSGGSSGKSGEGSGNSSGNPPSGSSGNPSGGGGATGQAESGPSSAFFEEVNAACLKQKKQFETEAAAFIEKSNKAPPKPTETPPEITLIETVLVPIFQTELAELSAVDAPAAEEAWFGEFLEALEQVIGETSDNPEGFLETGGSFGDAEKLAKAHGILICANV